MAGKVLFFTKINFGLNANGGLFNKVKAQVKALEKLGFHVTLVYNSGLDLIVNRSGSITTYSHTNRFKLLWHQFIQLPNQLPMEPNATLYIRHFMLNPLSLLGLLKLSKRFKLTLLEIPTFPYSGEYNKSSKGKLLLVIDRICFGLLSGKISRIVTFSKDETIRGIKTILTDNGVDTDLNRATSFNSIDTPRPIQLVAMGNPQTWHGYDRIIAGMIEYQQLQSSHAVVLHVIGEGGIINNLKAQVDNMPGLHKHILFHGFLKGTTLDQLLDQVDVGISSLGMHRIGAANGEASPLKTREYVSRAIPLVLAYQDKAFAPDFPYQLRFPADESIIPIHEIVRWFTELQLKDPDYKQKLRDYAVNRLSWNAMMKPIVDFISEAP